MPRLKAGLKALFSKKKNKGGEAASGPAPTAQQPAPTATTNHQKTETGPPPAEPATRPEASAPAPAAETPAGRRRIFLSLMIYVVLTAS